MEKFSRELAEQEVNKWLDCKKVSEKKRESYKDNIDSLVESIVDGTLILTDENVFVQELKFPIGNNSEYQKLEYAPRLKFGDVHQAMNGVKSNDADGRICAYVSALTGKPKNVVKAMDTEDYSVAQAIAVFFV